MSLQTNPLDSSSGHALKPMPAPPDQDFYRERMAKGSVSFTLAARLFTPVQQQAVQKLYAWCRYCDDQIDHAPSQAEAERRLQSLRRQTASALAGETQTVPEFIGFQQLAHEYRIPEHYAYELLMGFEMDVLHQHSPDLEHLELYCHRVAGVVGLMMSHVMGISDERALAYADAAGRALQLTNIARDVFEDLENGRIYLPLSWFRELGITAPATPASYDPEQVYPVIIRLLDYAESKYQTARAGLPYLPLRPALAVAAALEVYGGIGSAIRQRGAPATLTRTVLSGRQKAGLVLRGALPVIGGLPGRLLKPWRRVEIQQVRRFHES